MTDSLKSWIEGNCFTKTGGLNNRVAIRSWWVNKGEEGKLDELVQATSWLDTENITQRIYHVLNGLSTSPSCPVCGEIPTFKQFKSGYFRTCSHACAMKDEERNKKISQNTGVQKALQTSFERHGFRSSFERAEVQEKVKKSKLDKYGSLNPAIDKIRTTSRERYGADHWFSSSEGMESLKKLREEHGGSFQLDKETLSKLNDVEFLHELNKTMGVNDVAKAIGVMNGPVVSRLRKGGYEIISHPKKYGVLQKEIANFVKDCVGEIKVHFNDRSVIAPKELDIYVPDKRIGIELNGIYWHSFSKKETKEERLKHLKKLELCLSHSIRLLQITDLEWNMRREACESIIMTALGFHEKTLRASSCKVVEISHRERRKFLESNHIQGDAQASSWYGLAHDDDIVAVMSFSKSRFDKAGTRELLRFAVKKGYRVHGAGSKLFNSFPFEPTISYCDRSLFNGGLYESLGFEHQHDSPPGYFWWKNGSIITRVSAQKHRLSKLLGEDFNSSETEVENMFRCGYRRYWNCGNSVWVKNK